MRRNDSTYLLNNIQWNDNHETIHNLLVSLLCCFRNALVVVSSEINPHLWKFLALVRQREIANVFDVRMHEL